MKKRNAGAVLLLIWLSVCFLGGCGAKKEETMQALTGIWSMECNFSELIKTEFVQDQDIFIVKAVFEFAEDGTYKMYIDRNSLTESIDKWLDAFAAYGTELMYTTMEEKGLTREDTELIFEEKYGCGITEYMRDTAEAQLDFNSMFAEMMSEGVFETEDNRLYMSTGDIVDEGQYVIFSVDGNTLTLNLPEGVEKESTLPGVIYPFVLTKEN